MSPTHDEALAALFDAHVAAEFVAHDLDATMATMTAVPYVNHVPVLSGAYGRDAVRAFYGRDFIGRWPADLTIERVSRTVGQGRIVDEMVLRFTHDVAMPAILPGIAPTGKRVEIPFVAIVGTEGDKIAYEHIYWDNASLLAQVGVLDPAGLPVSGAEQVARLLDPSFPANPFAPQ